MKKTLLILLLAVIYAAPAIAADDASNSSVSGFAKASSDRAGSSSSSSAAATITQTDDGQLTEMSIEAIFERGKLLYMKNDLINALKRFDTVLEEDNVQSVTRQMQAEAYYYCGMIMNNPESKAFNAKAAHQHFNHAIAFDELPEHMKSEAQRLMYNFIGANAERNIQRKLDEYAARRRASRTRTLVASAFIGAATGALTTFAAFKVFGASLKNSGKFGIFSGMAATFVSCLILRS